jgi:hypothetical protein
MWVVKAIVVILSVGIGIAWFGSSGTRLNVNQDESRVVASKSDRRHSSVKIAGYRLYAAPTKLSRSCRQTQSRVTFPVLCPGVLPRARDGTRPRTYLERPDSSSKWLYVGASYGSPYDPHWEWNNPDLFLHFVVFEGKVPPNTLELSGTRHPQRLVGTRTLGGHRGKLYKQVPYAICGCGLGGHFTFIWNQNGVTYAASLHRWSPKPTLRVLDALISQLKRV